MWKEHCVEVTGQPVGVSSLLPPCAFGRANNVIRFGIRTWSHLVGICSAGFFSCFWLLIPYLLSSTQSKQIKVEAKILLCPPLTTEARDRVVKGRHVCFISQCTGRMASVVKSLQNILLGIFRTQAVIFVLNHLYILLFLILEFGKTVRPRCTFIVRGESNLHVWDCGDQFLASVMS